MALSHSRAGARKGRTVTRRAARMLAALEDGCTTRAQLYAHVGSYFLCNNGAAELRAAGIDVVCVSVDGDYWYVLAPVIRRPEGAPCADGEGLHLGGRDSLPGAPLAPAPVPLVEETSGQIAFGVAA